MINFSIIIPTYNYGHLISNAIQSIVDQLSSIHDIAIEVIIVNDCSTDNTLDVLAEYSDYDFIKIINNPRNMGAAFSRNTAIKQASGEYIIFLDADDTLTDNSIQTIHNFINCNDSKNLNDLNISPQLILADHNNITHQKNSDVIITKTVKNSKLSDDAQQRFINYLFDKSISLTAGSVIFKREILEKFKFSDTLKLNEDLPLFAHALLNFECQYLPFATVNILKHDLSLRNNYNLLSATANAIEITDIIFDPKCVPKELLHLKKKYLSLRYLSLFRSHYLAKQPSQARDFYHQAIILRWANIFKINYLSKYLKSFV